MRIAYVCADPGVPVFGSKGCSVHVQEVVRALTAQGHSVTLFARRWGGEPPQDLTDIECVALAPLSIENREAREAALAAADRLVPCMLTAHEPFDMVYERYALWSGSAMHWARERSIPSILEVNAPLVEEQALHRTLHDRSLAEAISFDALSSARHVVAVSSGVAGWLISEGIDPGKIEVVANGVDTTRFAPSVGEPGKVPVIGFVGTLKPWHGVEILIEAAAELARCNQEFRLCIVGDGPQSSALKEEARERGLEGLVEFNGAIAPEDIPAVLSGVDIAVAPYPDLEGFYFSPLKVMEYMAAGKAVVASRIGDIDGLVSHRVDGMLCPPGDVRALAATLEELLESADLRSAIGQRARDKAVDQLGWDRAVRRILAMAGEREPC